MPNDVHPQIQAILDRTSELGIPKIQDLETGAARVLFEQMAAARRETYPPPQLHQVENTSTGAGYGHLPVRIYRTADEASAPVIVFYHGGGHVVGSLNTVDTAARFLALTTGCTLVSVDYRMGPEHPFPAAVTDAYDAARWVADHADALRVNPLQLAVCGDSAGGNLAAVVSLMARDSGKFSVSAQALIYPVVNCRGVTESYVRYGNGYGLLEADTVTWFMDQYLPHLEQRDDWRASPVNAASHSGLPPTLVLTAECDVLRDEGVDYAVRLKAAGTSAEHVEFPGMIHGFFGYLGLVDDAERAHETVAGFLKRVWGRTRRSS